MMDDNTYLNEQIRVRIGREILLSGENLYIFIEPGENNGEKLRISIEHFSETDGSFLYDILLLPGIHFTSAFCVIIPTTDIAVGIYNLIVSIGGFQTTKQFSLVKDSDLLSLFYADLFGEENDAPL